METFGLGIILFTLIVLALVDDHSGRALASLVSTGNVNITINGEKTISVPAGGKLLQTLAELRNCSCPPPVAAVAPVRSVV